MNRHGQESNTREPANVGGSNKQRFIISLWAVFVVICLGTGIWALFSKSFVRQELQTINRRFELRPWLVWTQSSLNRLSWPLLWQYHEAHEIPRQWWAWDYTLSWLIENNHPAVKHKIIVFNHLLEDEPPQEAVAQFPWMKPLLTHPISRESLAEVLQFLGKSGVKLIILDNDFPQYTNYDKTLATTIHKLSTGELTGHKVPVLMARTVNRRSTGNMVQFEVPSTPSGILEELQRLEPDVDVERKYTGITGVFPDEDQVVRRLAVRLPSLTGKAHSSIVLNALDKLGEKGPGNVPDVMDIDFACPPNSEYYPVRPISYLLDPDRRKQMRLPDAQTRDVTLKDAVVFIGDGVFDVYSTPFTNAGMNQMSGPEILVHALETVSRRSWLTRLETAQSILYFLFISIVSGALWVLWKLLQQATMNTHSGIFATRIARSLCDLACLFLLLVLSSFWSSILFSYFHLIVPAFIPPLGILVGAIATTLWEREREREEVFQTKLQAAEEKLELAQERYESDLKRQEAEAKSREVLMDRQIRREFVRRINHDLNAPVSVLNWTLADLQMGDLPAQEVNDKIGRLVKNSDKLCELIDQLVQSYDYDAPVEEHAQSDVDLKKLVTDAIDLQQPLAKFSNCSLSSDLPEQPAYVHANALELTRVIDNLVRNAIKHNPQGTNIDVSLNVNGSYYLLNVQDNGKGISPEHLNHIFEPGYRINPNKVEGQGLGLDIVSSLVERMGGKIEVESVVNKGTTFTVKLPMLDKYQDKISGQDTYEGKNARLEGSGETHD